MCLFARSEREWEIAQYIICSSFFSISVTFKPLLLWQEISIRNHNAEKNWSNMELELISEGGIWGPEKVNTLEKWMLDDVEGTSIFGEQF